MGHVVSTTTMIRTMTKTTETVVTVMTKVTEMMVVTVMTAMTAMMAATATMAAMATMAATVMTVMTVMTMKVRELTMGKIQLSMTDVIQKVLTSLNPQLKVVSGNATGTEKDQSSKE